MEFRQYEVCELSFTGPAPEGPETEADLTAVFSRNGTETRVRGFYAGGGNYRIRFLPEEAGTYRCCVSGSMLKEPCEGELDVLPAAPGRHGPVRAEGTALRYADGTPFHSFGTTVYALAHQSDALVEETMHSLASAPFNKIRICLFPKHYNYNFNEPPCYPFRPKEGRAERAFAPEQTPIYPHKSSAPDDYWDVRSPNYVFWDRFETLLRQLDAMGIQADLILFHPYDRWGFANLSPEDDLAYLDYLLRRFAAFPNVWWSLANEYDLCFNKTQAQWDAIESYVAHHDPFRHPLGNHNCFKMWDAGREYTDHVSWQTKQFFRVGELMRRFGKPVLVDECRYEGTVPEFWGNLSGRDMVRAFWKVTAQGGYCTHGETFLPGTPMGDRATDTGETDVVWWARGGKLNGESPARIAFLRKIIESLPGHLEPMPGMAGGMLGRKSGELLAEAETSPAEMQLFLQTILRMDDLEREHFIAAEFEFAGRCGEDAYLWYKDDQCCAAADLALPEGHSYRVELIDTWEMTRQTVLRSARGKVRVPMPGRAQMALLALREDT